MSIIAKYKFDKTIYADLLPEFNAEFTSDKYNTTDEEVDGIITRTIESDSFPTLMRFGRLWVDGESATDNRTDSLLEVLEMNTNGLTDCDNMFRYCKNLTSITCEWDTSNIINMYSMFNNCNKLTSLDVSNFNTSEVTTMYAMFHNCNNLTSLDVSNFDTSKVTRMDYMFFNCHKLTSLDVSNFNTSNATRMDYMFTNCTNLATLDVSNFNTSNVINMNSMFTNCNNLTSLDVSNFNTGKVTNTHDMFSGCYNLTSLDVSNWNTSNVTNMIGMFYNCTKLTSLDLSNFDTSNVADTTNMFYNTPLLTDIGMLYCDQSTINKIASLLPADITQTIWVEDVDVKDLTPVEGVEFKQYAKNTEIMLTSPLLEGDKLIVKDGKLYHYHKMGMVVLDGSENWWKDASIGANTSRYGINIQNAKNTNTSNKLMCNLFTCSGVTTYGTNVEDTQISDNNLYIRINTSKAQDVVGFQQWLQVNPTTVVYELASPYYELISEDPLDISLISETVDITNSSNIPLNMTINNKGLSTVAMSPSTTYTVAFDKDTDSEVVVNLCGNEATTTDNIVEITTPSEIDDELIFYGDGVEVSNVRLLEGSVSGDSIPRESFEGLKSSFEDGYIENMVNDNRYRCVLKLSQPNGTTPFEEMYPLAEGNRVRSDLLEVKSNTTYTVHTPGYIVAVHEYNSNKIWIKDHLWQSTEAYTFNTRSDCTGLVIYIKKSDNKVFTEDEANSVSMILLEEKEFNNLGKYKVEYKVTGKNKLNLPQTFTKSMEWSEINTSYLISLTELKPNTDYYIKLRYDKSNNEVGHGGIAVYMFDEIPLETDRWYLQQNNRYDVWDTTEFSCDINKQFNSENHKYLAIYLGIATDTAHNHIATITNSYLIEGTTATEYEPYKEYTKTFYLNSPLLEGDTIEDINGKATHVKRYEKVVLDGGEEWIQGVQNPSTNLYPKHYRVTNGKSYSLIYCDKFIYKDDYYSEIDCVYLENDALIFMSKEDINGFKQWLSENPTTIIYELASPILEPISTEPILCDSYVNGHLDVDTNVPIKKVKFDWSVIPLKYISSSTNYLLQFDADNDGILNWMQSTYTNVLLNTNIVKGKNKLRFTTPNASTQLNELWIGGIGFNASNIQVVATDRDADFGYFKGLQSSFEEKTTENLFDESCLSTWWLVTATNIDKTDTSGKYFSIITKAEEGKKYTIKYDYMNRYIYAFLDENYEILRGSSEKSMFTTFQAPKNTKYLMCYISSNGIKEEDYDNIQVVENSENFGYEVKCKVVGKNKFDIEGDVNQHYPTMATGDIMFNQNQVNGNTLTANLYSSGYHGRGQIIKVKPNTDYTISVDVLQSTGVVAIHTITENNYYLGYFNDICNHKLTFNTGNNNEICFTFITNGDATTTKAVFSNIQLEEGTQATEYEPYQEYTKTIYLNSPLLKGDTIEVHNGKLCHYHKMGMVVLDGSEDWGESTSTYGEGYRHSHRLMSAKEKGFLITDKFRVVEYVLDGNTNLFFFENTMSLHTYSNLLYIHTKLALNDFKQWLQANPTTVVYELAEPYYEEITPIQEDLIITSVKEGDLHIDTIVPISSKVTYNVNVQLLTDFEQSIVEQVQATQTTDLQSILDEEIDN